MKTLIEILKGIVIGIANIVPGVSGGTLAVVMGIYDKLIDAITTVFKHPIQTIKSIWMYIVGVALGVGSSVVGVSYLLEHHPIPTTSLFIGLIIGAIPLIIMNVDKKKIQKKDIIVFIVMLLIVMGMPFLSLINVTATVSMSPFMLLIIGLISAATMVIPGVSGSMVLMSIGYYDKIAALASDTIKSLVTFNMDVLIQNIIILIPFAIGVILGIILVAKLIKWLLEKFNQTVHWAILGLVVASPFAVIMNLDLKGMNLLSIVLSIICFGIGCFIANLFSKIKE